jgi:hypothetical protein
MRTRTAAAWCALVAVIVAGCGSTGNVAKVAARSGQAESILVAAAAAEARGLGRSTDEVTGMWLSRIAAEGRSRYLATSPEARGAACDAITSYFSDTFDKDPLTVPSASVSAIKAVVALNDTAGNQALLKDVEGALSKPNTLVLIGLSAATCEVAGAE